MTRPQTRNSIAAQQGTLTIEDTGYVAGIDIGGTNLRLALADMRGAIVAKWSCSTAGVRGAGAVMALINNGMRHLLREVSATPGALKAVGAGAPGITDVDAGIVIATSFLMGWRDVPLRAMLEDAFNVPATVDNDVNLAAIGESWAGAAKGVQDFVFLAIGTGIGAGIVLNGRPFRGKDWAAGEIGYMLVPGVRDIPNDHGEPGSLESTIGGEGIKAQWQNVWSADRTALPKDLAATEIFDHALTGDPLAQTILDQSAHLLSQAIYNINLVLNCPLFVLGGGVGMHQGLCQTTRDKLQQRSTREQPQITNSTLGSDAQIMGALRLALDTADARPVALLENASQSE